MTADERIASLEALVTQQQGQFAQQREQIAQLSAYVRKLEGRLAKESHNRSKPPSSDGLRRKTKSLRQQSGKKPGGQLGHRGETLRLQATPDVVVEHRPTHCTHCQAPLAEAPVLVRERRHVQDLPPGRLMVTEHQALHLSRGAPSSPPWKRSSPATLSIPSSPDLSPLHRLFRDRSHSPRFA